MLRIHLSDGVGLNEIQVNMLLVSPESRLTLTDTLGADERLARLAVQHYLRTGVYHTQVVIAHVIDRHPVRRALWVLTVSVTSTITIVHVRRIYIR